MNPDLLFSITVDQPGIQLACAPKDDKGDAVTDGVKWSVDDATVGTIMPSADGLSCIVSPLKVGVCKVTCTDGQLSQTAVCTFVAGAPASLNLSGSVLPGSVLPSPAPAPVAPPVAAPAAV